LTESQGLVSATLHLEPDDSHRLARLCGPFDQNLRQVEKRLGIAVRNRGNAFQLSGRQELVELGEQALRALYDETADGAELPADKVHLLLQEAVSHRFGADGGEVVAARAADVIQVRRKSVKVRGRGQQAYVDAIRRYDVNFGIGPAGTGKTYLAVACAVEALEQERIARILLVRPAVEAGEKLGFLPGDLTQKIDPYLRPLYDALYEFLGTERVTRLIERNQIEVAPLAYMRGRTLNGSFIILDESQNTTIEQMKMFLTRLGFGSTAVITGDVTQIDLPRGTRSGLKHVMDVLRGVEGVSFTEFQPGDVVRHPLVQRIVEAYEAHDAADRDRAGSDRAGTGRGGNDRGRGH
jgi:phosphate starvation-inducible PhoH-like protein